MSNFANRLFCKQNCYRKHIVKKKILIFERNKEFQVKFACWDFILLKGHLLNLTSCLRGTIGW